MRIPVVTAVQEATRYGFAVGKVRVLETRILGRASYERLLDAESFEEQRRILSDTLYGRYLEGVSTADGVERALSQALDGFYGFLDEAALPASVTRFFRVRYDYANLKAALKAQRFGVPVTGMLEDLGTVEIDAFSRPLAELPEPLGELAARLLSAEEGAVDENLDSSVDGAMFARLVELARESRSSFLSGLAALMVDIANAKTVLRARTAGMPVTALGELLLEGGTAGVDDLLEAYQLALPDLAAVLTRNSNLAAVGITDGADLRRLDVVADNIVVNYLRTARAVSIGPEPVIAYVLAREAEIVALRTVLLGKLSKIDPGVVRERLRDLYV